MTRRHIHVSGPGHERDRAKCQANDEVLDSAARLLHGDPLGGRACLQASTRADRLPTEKRDTRVSVALTSASAGDLLDSCGSALRKHVGKSSNVARLPQRRARRGVGASSVFGANHHR